MNVVIDGVYYEDVSKDFVLANFNRVCVGLGGIPIDNYQEFVPLPYAEFSSVITVRTLITGGEFLEYGWECVRDNPFLGLVKGDCMNVYFLGGEVVATYLLLPNGWQLKIREEDLLRMFPDGFRYFKYHKIGSGK